MCLVRISFISSALLLAACSWAIAQDVQVQTSQVLNDQWFTGPLVAPSPALPKAGLIALEPYEFVQLNTGRYAASGSHSSGSHQARTESVFSLVEYAITDRLSIQALPQINYAWNDLTTTRGIVGSDVPVDLKYRVLDQMVNTARPSITFDLGMSFPTGPYDRLGSSLEGVGSGTWYLRERGILQWLMNTAGDHPLRIRLWGGLSEPLNSPGVRDVSAYDTGPGFRGKVNAGLTSSFGISPEYALSQRWVLAADLFGSYADGPHLTGFGSGGSVDTRSGSSMSWALAPAIEYNWSPQYGIIAGVQFSFAGHNTSSYVAPQIALNLVF